MGSLNAVEVQLPYFHHMPLVDEATLVVTGMETEREAETLQAELGQVAGVERVASGSDLQRVWVRFNPFRVELEQLQAVVRVLGYEVQ